MDRQTDGPIDPLIEVLLCTYKINFAQANLSISEKSSKCLGLKYLKRGVFDTVSNLERAKA